MNNAISEAVPSTPFSLTMHRPFSTFIDGRPRSIPYVIDGLLPSGGFSIISAKPKLGKSSLSRYEATCVAKGQPFLGRDTERGEVLLISLEDPQQHVDNCLGALGYDIDTDSLIHIVTKLPPRIDESIAAIDDAVSKNKNINLVIVDTLAKLLRCDDLNDYSRVLPGVEKISALARKHEHLHVQGLAHAKKVKTDDPFDSTLGSTALRGEPDGTIILLNERGQHLIAAETRIGRPLPLTLLNALTVESAGAVVVAGYSLGVAFGDWQRAETGKAEHRHTETHEERIIKALKERWECSAAQSVILDEVKGKTTLKLEAIKDLVAKGVVTTTGTKQSRTNPLVLHLNESAIQGFLNNFVGASGESDDVA